jgi:hypothetical protein
MKVKKARCLCGRMIYLVGGRLRPHKLHAFPNRSLALCFGSGARP